MYKLRELIREDIPIINKWRSTKDMINYLGAPFRFINEEVEELWFDNYMKNRSNTVRCSIIDKENNLLGLVSLTNINHINQSATMHIMIGEENNRGKGVGKYGVTSILTHAFLDLNINRVSLTVLADNERAKRLYDRIGFKTEGVSRQAVFKNGSFHDMYAMSILKNEFESRSNNE